MNGRAAPLKAPLLVSWQLTRECDLCCLHCCTDSAPGKRLTDELDANEAMDLAREIAANDVPYVMLCGGEPLIVPHFFDIAETLGNAGTQLKIESNGQSLDGQTARRLAALPIRSVQISLDGDTQSVYARQRPGGSLASAHAACREIKNVDLPLEITFAPTRLNIHEAEAVLERAVALGAFRFNTGRLMRIGTAARLWDRLEPSAQQYAEFRAMLQRRERLLSRSMEICYLPFSIEDGLRASSQSAPATLLVLPNGRVKVASALPFICADLRSQSLAEAWLAYREAWRTPQVRDAVKRVLRDPSRLAEANIWKSMPLTASIEQQSRCDERQQDKQRKQDGHRAAIRGIEGG